jgi:hypothetical protein
MERARLAGGRERLEGGEAHVDEEIVGPGHRGREHHVGAPVVERVACELDRVERTRAGGVQGHRGVAEAEIERARREERGEAGGKTIARVDAIGRVDAAPHLFREVRQAGGWERQIGEHEAGARTKTRRVLHALKRFTRRVEHELEERIEAVDLRGREREARGIETIFEAADVAAAERGHAIGGRPVLGCQIQVRIDAPSAIRHVAQQVVTGEHSIEQLLGAEGAGERVRLGDDRDRFETLQAPAFVSTMCISMPRSSHSRRPSSVRTIASDTVLRSETERDLIEQWSGPSAGSSR